LQHHIVQGNLAASDLTDGQELQAISGQTLQVERIDEELRVGGAVVSEADIGADNGVIHGIDDVLRSNLNTGDRLSLTPIVQDFVDLVSDSGRLPDLADEGGVTVFAPINNAFDLLGAPTVDLLTRGINQDVQDRVVDFHIVSGIYPLEALEEPLSLENLDGSTLTVVNENGVITVDGYRVLSEGVQTSNGLIYLLDNINLNYLNIEQRLRISPTLTTYATEIRDRPSLRALLEGAEEHTLFAAVNLAFLSLDPDVIDALNNPENSALFDRIIQVHIVEGTYSTSDLYDGLVLTSIDGSELTVRVTGDQFFIKNGQIAIADIPVENGAFHIIDNLIFPEVDLVDRTLLSGHTDHVDALMRTGLDGVFRESTSRTLFAFPNEVYSANPGLLSHPQLDQIILYHAAVEDIGQLFHGLVFESMEGTLRTVTQDPQDAAIFRLDGITPIVPVATASNGRLLVAEGFMLPPELRHQP
ncbi:MAG: fasciclin domain-containing protein, partial [Rubricoccaceae bacterium]|nr:fasciclin domain-containing protein [Rubricoccaceae bacterium]